MLDNAGGVGQGVVESLSPRLFQWYRLFKCGFISHSIESWTDSWRSGTRHELSARLRATCDATSICIDNRPDVMLRHLTVTPCCPSVA